MDAEVKEKLFKLNGGRWNTGQVVYFEDRHYAQCDYERERHINEQEALRVFRLELARIDRRYLKYIWP